MFFILKHGMAWLPLHSNGDGKTQRYILKALDKINRYFSDSVAHSVWFAVFSSAFLLFMCYVLDNFAYSILTGPTTGQKIELFNEFRGKIEDRNPEDYVFVNVAYDRELATVYDEDSFPKGEIDITNRGKLTDFLSQLGDSHKYVMVDVLLSDEFHTGSDSALIDVLSSTPRLILAKASGETPLDSALLPISAYVDYSGYILETNFVKYQFIKDGESTMPYRVWEALENPEPVKQWGPFFFSNNHLQWNSLILRFPIKLWSEKKSKEGNQKNVVREQVLHNLGSDILDMGVDIPRLVKDKIVVIGDFTANDMHDTYLGTMAGPVININALEALRNRDLEIPWTLIAFLFIFYGWISYLVIRNVPVGRIFLANIKGILRGTAAGPAVKSEEIVREEQNKSKVVRYFKSLVGFGLLFLIVSSVIYITTGIDVNVLLPSIWFSFLRGITNNLLS